MRRSSIVTGLLAATLLLPGCMHWKYQSVPPEQVVAGGPGKVRIQRSDSTTVELKGPRMSGDSIVGTGKQDSVTGVPLTDVSRIATRRVDGVATAIVVALIVPVIYFTLIWEEP